MYVKHHIEKVKVYPDHIFPLKDNHRFDYNAIANIKITFPYNLINDIRRDDHSIIELVYMDFINGNQKNTLATFTCKKLNVEEWSCPIFTNDNPYIIQLTSENYTKHYEYLGLYINIESNCLAYEIILEYDKIIYDTSLCHELLNSKFTLTHFYNNYKNEKIIIIFSFYINGEERMNIYSKENKKYLDSDHYYNIISLKYLIGKHMNNIYKLTMQL